MFSKHKKAFRQKQTFSETKVKRHMFSADEIFFGSETTDENETIQNNQTGYQSASMAI